ncbi:MAG: helix-turn-helix domain-containing protein [Anaerolineales bacterium]|jgi:DNA-binding HxlR family transcriptional regulator
MSKRPVRIPLDGCPVAKTARLIGRKWVLLIIRDLVEGPRRFTALQQSLQVNPRTLSQRLSQLEAEGIIRRQCYAEVPPRVEYSLLEKGDALVPILKEMHVFGRKWL